MDFQKIAEEAFVDELNKIADARKFIAGGINKGRLSIKGIFGDRATQEAEKRLQQKLSFSRQIARPQSTVKSVGLIAGKDGERTPMYFNV